MFNKKNILWDFDGVILDSMVVRDWGFEEIFKNFDAQQVSELLKYHRANGGLSRYVKIRYFYENILGESITEEKVMLYAENFSVLMKKELTNPKNLILDAVSFIKSNYQKYHFHIVSGSDGEELRFLCKELGLTPYFLSIEGSPTPKKVLVKNLLKNHNYILRETCLIGDSINDYEAAKANNIHFYGYNNKELNKLDGGYIPSLNVLNTNF
ncbi:HAD hydrolase-like protein [Polaribacter vadi]|uniref:HAD family hydrolase n=1 Tax=Polaribacter TaxID=52959 RepID=UPI001C0907E3|nr:MULTISPECIES: HAD hydrolase-like protein [Polaribacter]MBU3010337.1 HAD hydrolase-like protein [Polaribacter vadi]MDO6740144.1 HAD hydrolase-like protein [Polaribacter sp. 1_MG-2023]